MSKDKCPKCGADVVHDAVGNCIACNRNAEKERLRNQNAQLQNRLNSAELTMQIHAGYATSCHLENERLIEENIEVEKENAALQAIMGKLPKTADGVIVYPGSELHFKHTVLPGKGKDKGKQWDVETPIILEEADFNVCVSFDAEDHECFAFIDECYSTREAAEEASVRDE